MAGSSGGSAAGNPLRPVPIRDLLSQAEGRSWTLAQHLDGLPSLTPVRGRVRAVHRGSVLEVDGEAETIVTLRCDRCLQHYNHPLSFHTRELIWLRHQGAGPVAGPLNEAGEMVPAIALDNLALGLGADGDDGGVEASLEGSGEELDPEGRFDPGHWTFEQLSLQLPLVNRCGPDCPGPASWGHGEPAVDPRWAALAALQPPPAGQTDGPA